MLNPVFVSYNKKKKKQYILQIYTTKVWNVGHTSNGFVWFFTQQRFFHFVCCICSSIFVVYIYSVSFVGKKCYKRTTGCFTLSLYYLFARVARRRWHVKNSVGNARCGRRIATPINETRLFKLYPFEKILTLNSTFSFVIKKINKYK